MLRLLLSIPVLVLLASSLARSTLRGVPLSTGDSAETSITPVGDVDRYVLDCFAGGRLSARARAVKAKAARGSSLQPSLALLDPDGAALELGSRLRVKGRKASVRGVGIARTGRYTVLVSGNGETTGEYRLKVNSTGPRRVRARRQPIGPGEEFTLRFGADTDSVAKVRYSTRGGSVEVVSVRTPSGTEMAGGRESIRGSKRGGRGTLYPAAGHGEYEIVFGNASADLRLTAAIRVRPARSEKRRLTLTPNEPQILVVSPDASKHPGSVAVHGENFQRDAVVWFGDEPSPETAYLSPALLQARVPNGSGTVGIAVVNPDGQEDSLAEAFTFTLVPTWMIIGAVTGARDAGIAVDLAGDTVDTTVTGPDGLFVFTGVTDGTFAVTPDLPTYTVVPPTRPVTVEGGNVTGVDFTTVFGSSSVNPFPPARTVKLLFIHQKAGANWLDATNGELADRLQENRYFVSDIGSGWDGPDDEDLGDLTDIGHWYTWFLDQTLTANGQPHQFNLMRVLFREFTQSLPYDRLADPEGENEIVMFKSGYRNSAVKDDNSEPATALFGQNHLSNAHTLSNAKEVYRELLGYFQTRRDKMFVVLTAPPIGELTQNAKLTEAANARKLNLWLVNEWLREGDTEWENRNVYVFDLYNVWTAKGNHHRVVDGDIEYITNARGNFASPYYTHGILDSYVDKEANQKATDEFVPMLNTFYHRWRNWYAGE